MNSPRLTNILLTIIGILLAVLVYVFYQNWQATHITQYDYERTDSLGQQNPQPFNQQQAVPVNQNTVPVSNTTMNGTAQIQSVITFGRATFKSTGTLYKDSNLPTGSSYIGLDQNDGNSEVISQGMNSRSFDPGDSSQMTFVGNQIFGSNQYGVYKLSGGKTYYWLVSGDQAFSVTTPYTTPRKRRKSTA
jgi:hypothetical protein